MIGFIIVNLSKLEEIDKMICVTSCFRDASLHAPTKVLVFLNVDAKFSP